MDEYERLLEEKKKRAMQDIACKKEELKGNGNRSKLQIQMDITELEGEVGAYQDALNEYRQFKAKDGK